MDNIVCQSGVPHKFSPFRRTAARHWQHLCHIPPDSPIMQALCSLYAQVSTGTHTSRPSIAVLPPASWQMTMTEGATDTYRQANCWPAGKETWMWRLTMRMPYHSCVLWDSGWKGKGKCRRIVCETDNASALGLFLLLLVEAEV